MLLNILNRKQENLCANKEEKREKSKFVLLIGSVVKTQKHFKKIALLFESSRLLGTWE